MNKESQFRELLDSLGDSPDATPRLIEELNRLPSELAACGCALAYYARALSAGSNFVRQGRRYVLSPANFIAITPHYQRKSHIKVEIRGRVSEFADIDNVRMRDARGGSYSSFVLSRSSELRAATCYVRQAADLYRKGRGRLQAAPRRQSGQTEGVVPRAAPPSRDGA